ncbi:ribose-5-phosphate isomerase [Chitinophaga costaii]|uniref:Ribose-5-phosphate isomerase A n=1 Tax=Chitinophaga costaii TaxID=1335309 RepID=A0A1C4AXT7_9BACT|nr:ribose-5-phosphate isomerase RpiA [Chitinophaga costaii]PUZ26793.1 ribose-5-phosphate isomerase RpiA [Chitinophaga costaii]SCB99397.1 ribose-5-phosphate isomerase [Chitinophaga costaii]
MANADAAKKAAGIRAVDFIENGMKVGLGTGSTAYWAIMEIGNRVRQGLQISAIATSVQSEELAREQQIPLLTFTAFDYLDIDIDGADEVDENLQLTKGGGGALLREKIIASASRKLIVVADEHKFVPHLGAFPLPVEVTPFGWEYTFRQLTAMSGRPKLRQKDGKTFITDNGNYIADCNFGIIKNPKSLETLLNAIPGVVENGLFVDRTNILVLGFEDGTTKILSK